MILESVHQHLHASDSPVQILTPKMWVRELYIEGTKAYEIGTVCDTCEFLFERSNTAPNRKFHDLIPQSLRNGLSSVSDEEVEKIATIMPAGEYHIGLHRVTPCLVTPNDSNDYFSNEQVALWGLNSFWGLPNFPRTKYYRTFSKKFDRSLFCEFIIPLFPPHWCYEDEIMEYRRRLNQGDEPTALTISVLDIKSPAEFDSEPTDIDSHWCLAHYLLDGHHKVYAASQERRPINMLSFLSVDSSIASEEEIRSVLEMILR